MEEKIKALLDLDETIRLRRENPQEGSYTCYLFDKGFQKYFRNKKQHRSGLAVRLNKMHRETPTSRTRSPP